MALPRGPKKPLKAILHIDVRHQKPSKKHKKAGCGWFWGSQTPTSLWPAASSPAPGLTTTAESLLSAERRVRTRLRPPEGLGVAAGPFPGETAWVLDEKNQ